MWILLTAVLTASLLGSMHCVGMCGPLAIWASGAALPSGAGEPRPRRQVLMAGSLYHLGRCVTYVLMGIVAGMLGGIVDAGGELAGYQLAAARLAGTLMVAFGIVKLWTLAGLPGAGTRSHRPSRIGAALVRLRPLIFRLPPSGRAFATGLATTLLPCGWLYLFALVAAGTGSGWIGPIVMFAFWLGTVPALSTLIAGTRVLSHRFQRVVPALAAGLLILTGCYTASGRGFANLDAIASWRDSVAPDSQQVQHSKQVQHSQQTLLDRIDRAGETPLPCCQPPANLTLPAPAAPAAPAAAGRDSEAGETP